MDYVYKAIEEGNIINTKAMMYEIEQTQDAYPYKKVVLNKVFREEDKSPEMRNWSIFSDNVRYIQHEQKTSPKLNIDTLDFRQHKELYFKLKGMERETLDIDFGMYTDILRSKYLDMYKGVYAEMVYANKFNENSDLRTTYLGQTKMTRDTKLEKKNDFLLLVKDLLQENYWMVQNVKFVGHRCQQVLHVKILLFAMQNSTCNTKIFF